MPTYHYTLYDEDRDLEIKHNALLFLAAFLESQADLTYRPESKSLEESLEFFSTDDARTQLLGSFRQWLEFVPDTLFRSEKVGDEPVGRDVTLWFAADGEDVTEFYSPPGKTR